MLHMRTYLYEEDEDLIDIGEACPHIYVETQLLLKVMAKADLPHEPADQTASLPTLVLDTQRTAQKSTIIVQTLQINK